MMAPENTINYEDVLADLEADKAEIDNLIAYIKRKKLGLQTGAGGILDQSSFSSFSQTIPPQKSQFDAIRPDAFFGMTVLDAAKRYLSIVKEPQSARAISIALQRGGFKHQSKDFYNTVFSVLNRDNKQDGAIAKISNKWGLSEWYPGYRRGPKVSKPAPTSTDEESSDDLVG